MSFLFPAASGKVAPDESGHGRSLAKDVVVEPADVDHVAQVGSLYEDQEVATDAGQGRPSWFQYEPLSSLEPIPGAPAPATAAPAAAAAPTTALVPVLMGCHTLPGSECCGRSDGRVLFLGATCVLVGDVKAPSRDVGIPCQPDRWVTQPGGEWRVCTIEL